MQKYATLRISRNLQRTSSPLKATGADLADSVDWRTKGYVTAVKDQGACGSCWAFSVVEAMEGHLFNVTGKLVDLDPQQLVDCAGEFGNEGCGGGFMDRAFEYIIKYGLEAEKDYPYTGRDDACHYNPALVIANCSRFSYVDKTEDALKEAVATVGPISVGIDADSIFFYSSGIFYDPNCGDWTDHAVLAVGYGTEAGEDYWLVKNSWGTGWGEDGYIRMARNKDDMCGIATFATYCAQ